MTDVLTVVQADVRQATLHLMGIFHVTLDVEVPVESYLQWLVVQLQGVEVEPLQVGHDGSLQAVGPHLGCHTHHTLGQTVVALHTDLHVATVERGSCQQAVKVVGIVQRTVDGGLRLKLG